MTGTVQLALEGGSSLAGALTRAARHHGHELTHGPSGAEPATDVRLTCRRDGQTAAAVPLEPDDRLGRAIAEEALRHIMRMWPCGEASAVVLAPAGGAAGPAAAGPVDAITVGGPWVVEESGAHCLVRMLTAQQTRCWLVSYACESAREEGPGPQDPGIEVVPSWIARDTARLCEYMHDRGAADDWSEPLQLGAPQSGPGRRVERLFAFTEAAYARRLVASLLSEARRA
ncbi:hypothetical protein J2Z21_000918 [Streptomyces griseochromogenes]|uniref:Uncharacterized protein n=1 Tax=Streptomyces griseochromogenes TaxID=68214 RepID=A0A1B1AUY6_9ACTN|nr:hypothetical protein [Streptomyces griseochromogenes]ANP50332.1 hypothetical protein AVL59_12500 [Streptomyces griseochromogenes]MBP2047994.1 hypothetical protein [Streptomyces griseochromogenes]